MNVGRWELSALMLISSVFPGVVLPVGAMAADSEAIYPQRPITLVVGYSVGGGADTLARLLAKHMSDELGQKVLVENRPGAAGNIAAESVARAEADGYTLYVSTRPNAIHKLMYGRFSYDFANDLSPVGLLATVPSVIVVNKDSPIRSVQDVINLAKAHPKTLTYGSQGVGSDAHLLGELLQRETQTSLVHVPYRGAAPALTDLIGGRVDALFVSLPGALPHINAGSVRAIAAISRQRASAIEHIPTMEESGFIGLDMETWLGLMVPKGAPGHVTARLSQSVNAVLMNPRLQEAFLERGYVAPLSPNTPGTFGALIAEETEKWTAVVRERNIKPVQ